MEESQAWATVLIGVKMLGSGASLEKINRASLISKA